MGASGEGHKADADRERRALIAALETIGGDVCLAAARELDGLPAGADITLALRRAGLDAAGATRLAQALSTPNARPSRLTSLSLSYNVIGSVGAVAVVRALPTSLAELGLVECAIGDRGGRALVRWASRARQLRVLCVEGNKLSAGIKRELKQLSERTGGPMVVV